MWNFERSIITKRIKKKIKGLTVANIVAWVVFAFYSFTMLYALVFAMMSSLKTNYEFVFGKNFFPEHALWKNYLEAFEKLQYNNNDFVTMVWNTVWLAATRGFLGIMTLAVTSYIFSKYNFHGKTFMLGCIFVSMMLPLYGGSSATLKLYHRIGFYDSPLIVLASMSGIGGQFLIMRSYFDGVSWEYAEAAEIDGANDWVIFWKIMLPLAFPALFSLLLLNLIGYWNDYSTSIYYMPSYPTLAAGLYYYEKVALFNINYPLYFAGIVFSCLPSVFVFIIFEKRIMESITMGGLKG